MLETCLRGQETNIFFTHLFLCRLPAELRIMLGEDDHQDVRNLVSKADKLWALHGQKNNLIVSVDQPEEDSAIITAIGTTRGHGSRGNRSNRGQQSSRGHQPQPGNHLSSQQPRQPQQATGSTSAATAMRPSDLARMGSDLCFFHWSWGNKARNCVSPCGWQGN